MHLISPNCDYFIMCNHVKFSNVLAMFKHIGRHPQKLKYEYLLD